MRKFKKDQFIKFKEFNHADHFNKQKSKKIKSGTAVAGEFAGCTKYYQDNLGKTKPRLDVEHDLAQIYLNAKPGRKQASANMVASMWVRQNDKSGIFEII